ncbi:MAG: hypothetical protein ACR9NN_25265 [Nostochopsis sp.]
MSPLKWTCAIAVTIYSLAGYGVGARYQYRNYVLYFGEAFAIN